MEGFNYETNVLEPWRHLIFTFIVAQYVSGSRDWWGIRTTCACQWWTLGCCTKWGKSCAWCILALLKFSSFPSSYFWLSRTVFCRPFKWSVTWRYLGYIPGLWEIFFPVVSSKPKLLKCLCPSLWMTSLDVVSEFSCCCCPPLGCYFTGTSRRRTRSGC